MTTGKAAFVSSHIEKNNGDNDAHGAFIGRLIQRFLDEFDQYPKVKGVAELPLSPRQRTFCNKQKDLLFATCGSTVITRRIAAMMYFGCYMGWLDVVDEPRLGQRVFAVKGEDRADCFKVMPDGGFLVGLATLNPSDPSEETKRPGATTAHPLWCPEDITTREECDAYLTRAIASLPEDQQQLLNEQFKLPYFNQYDWLWSYRIKAEQVNSAIIGDITLSKRLSVTRPVRPLIFIEVRPKRSII
jgi:hypothetical protein